MTLEDHFITRYHQMTTIIYCGQNFMYVSMWVFVYVSINSLWLRNHQKKDSQWWTVEPDLFCWGASAKMTVLKSWKQLLWSSTDKPYDLSYYI